MVPAGLLYETTHVSNSAFSEAAPPSQGSVLADIPRPGLQPWRMVVEPTRMWPRALTASEFAADLSQVLAGTAAIEYQDPWNSFGRTYITTGMNGLLVQVAERLTAGGAENR
jgi:hypothetical protein